MFSFGYQLGVFKCIVVKMVPCQILFYFSWNLYAKFLSSLMESCVNHSVFTEGRRYGKMTFQMTWDQHHFNSLQERRQSSWGVERLSQPIIVTGKALLHLILCFEAAIVTMQYLSRGSCLEVHVLVQLFPSVPGLSLSSSLSSLSHSYHFAFTFPAPL